MVFALVSFEGPDRYSQAGGLGVRVSGLAEALVALGHETHLFFIGEPHLPGEERRGHLTLHRWAQWISAHCPGGVYDGEESKVADLTASLPAFLIDRIILPALSHGRTPIVIFEEWQTAECACVVAERLLALGNREQVVLAWNANNPYGFERIDWARLAECTTVTAVSRYMRGIIRCRGADARVIPNGIPISALTPVPPARLERLRAAAHSRANIAFLFKMARWEREKGWNQTLDALRLLRGNDGAARDSRPRTILVARAGGPNGSTDGLREAAESRGLRVTSFESEHAFTTGLARAVRDDADVINLQFGITPSLARLLYAFADGVLANSVSEPFGLVGLEAMASGGIVFTGGTGEDYALDRRNAIVLETLDARELVARWHGLLANPMLQQRLRRAGRRTARGYLWPIVAERMIETLRATMTSDGVDRGYADAMSIARRSESQIGPALVRDEPTRRAVRLPSPRDDRRHSESPHMSSGFPG